MNWKELLSWENIQFIGTVCGAIAATVYMSFKAFKTKLDKEFKDRKTDVSKHIKRQSDLDYEINKNLNLISYIQRQVRTWRPTNWQNRTISMA